MKLHFEPNLDYQRDAIRSVCDLFAGQELCRTEFTVTAPTADAQSTLGVLLNEHGIGNRLTLRDDALLSNLRAVQLRNGLPPSDSLRSHDFTIEMETGTGKTYVYLRTIFELHRSYGFTKFIIVVPSVAIKEGVYKSLQIMDEHFRSLYGNVAFEYFLYDASKLSQVRSFATSPQLQIMLATVGAINKKDVNNLYKEGEKSGDEKPIDLIRATHPILIVDEPQSVDGGLEGRGKEALGAMQPLCTLRYSATHATTHHRVFRLDAVDAYERQLVKQIEVASASIAGDHNRPYVKLLSTINKKGVISARVELDVQSQAGVLRQAATVQDGAGLEQLTGRALYAECRIGEIRVEKGKELLELRVPGGEHWLRPGEQLGGVSVEALHRQMIRRTIREHLDKELRLGPQGIKVLSLFFVDFVQSYRSYAADGSPQKGKLARLFEEEYRRQSAHPDYAALFSEVDHQRAAEEVHDGYFSIDRQGTWSDTQDNNQGNRDNAERAYQLIMRDKERLLSFESKLKFIFSHSALKEGWDNPNVFQICALREIGTERERRQTLGRGLRLCVNQQGERLRGFDINTLTVIATESYEEFADKLQKELEAESGVQSGKGRLKIRNADERKPIRTRQAVLQSEAWKALWERVKHQTTYRVNFDNEALLVGCTEALRDSPPVTQIKLQWRKGDLAIGKAGVVLKRTDSAAEIPIAEDDVELPDLLTELQEKTQLTRRSIVRILIESGRLDDFKRNPQQFIAQAAAILSREKQRAIVDGISYQRLGDDPYYAQERFEKEELFGYLRNTLRVSKSVHEQVIWNSEVERSFAEQLESNEAVKVYAKLPNWFKVPTPLGDYHPDWAVLIELEGAERLYFVVETKESLFADELRENELAKSHCGAAHFRALATGKPNPATYRRATKLKDLLTKLST